MQEQIQVLISQNPKQYTRKIKSNQEYMYWIEQNCDPDCNSIDIKSKIYTSITNEKIKCPCGSGKLRRFVNFKKGFAFCGNSNQCEAAHDAQCSRTKEAAKNWNKEAAKAKRAKTNKEKYGVENIGQIEKARKTRAEIYSDKEKVTLIQQKMKKTNLERYGVSHNMYKHINPDALNVLFEKNELSNTLLKNGLVGTSELLGVWPTTISAYHKKYDLNILKSNVNSSYEVECKHWLNSIGIFCQKDRTVCKPQELDIYIPSYNLAIEFNGLYWHSEALGKSKYYHFNKTKTCADKNIHLIHIFEDEWINHKDVCKSIISGFLNQQSNKIFGRKCAIEEITNQESRSFLERNHLQGYSPASINLALKYNNDIQLLMTFSKSRFNQKIQYEMIRLDSKINTQIIGGTQKLWNYFIEHYHPESVVTYCDKRWFRGQVYKNLGFENTSKAKPGYWYTDGIHRYHRSKFTKKKCVILAKKIQPELSMDYLNSLSENIITREMLGLTRIWDCGQDTWIWKR